MALIANNGLGGQARSTRDGRAARGADQAVRPGIAAFRDSPH